MTQVGILGIAIVVSELIFLSLLLLLPLLTLLVHATSSSILLQKTSESLQHAYNKYASNQEEAVLQLAKSMAKYKKFKDIVNV